MFDIGWSEMMIIAVLALLIMGPKELPETLRTVSKWVKKAKGLAREFQSGVDDVIREADLQDARKALEGTNSASIRKTVEDVIDPTRSLSKVQREVKDAADSLDDDEAGTIEKQITPEPITPGQAASKVFPQSDSPKSETKASASKSSIEVTPPVVETVTPANEAAEHKSS
ncbi:Sec-independent protein translocase protein TatB [Kiloniella laminariae]|uniref:Sec-independent protein translocase protein TatB n=1 Tax=Kiloniella laminariae TaxID=454162 RepID=A0ABT4LNE7_9PROT|nr:Sec-independent protein translocase protein TatB [Kiloniella laminariae]MCZ4282628.1 Sec-independent protein translocase protein TatB [Kiloniella laminariae]